MGIKLKKFFFALDRNSPVYRPGQLVAGSCIISLKGHLNLSQLQIILEGSVECKITETYTTSHTNSRGERETTTHYIHYTESDNLVYFQYNPGRGYPPVLNAGKHSIDFAFRLPSTDLPSSFEGDYGHIRYRLRAKIQTPRFTFDKKNQLEITMRAPAYYPMSELMTRISNTNTKTIGIFTSNKVTIICHKRKGHNIGSTIPIECYVENNSTKTLGLRATINQEIHFNADVKHKCKKNQIAVTKGNSIKPKSIQREVLSLSVPSTSPVTSDHQLIEIKYRIILTLVIPFQLNLDCELPCIITDEFLPDDVRQC